LSLSISIGVVMQLAALPRSFRCSVPARALVFGLLVGRLGLRSPDATLDLTIAAFVMGAAAFGLLTVLPVLAHQKRLAPHLARYGPFLILAYAQAVVVVVALLLLSIFGLA